MRDLPPKGIEAARLARDGVKRPEIAERLGLRPVTVRNYLYAAERAGLVTRADIGPRFIRLKGERSRSRQFALRLSSDVADAIEAEARRRDRPFGWVLARIVTAAVDECVVAALIDGEGEP